MNTITQTMQFRQALIKYAEKHGVTAAANPDPWVGVSVLTFNVSHRHYVSACKLYLGSLKLIDYRTSKLREEMKSFTNTHERFKRYRSNIRI